MHLGQPLTVIVTVLPATLQKDALHQYHDSPQTGHQGSEKTLYWLRQSGMLGQLGKRCGAPLQVADARPLPDQTAARITTELVDLFTTYGIPEIAHSDQGRHFENAISQQVLKAFGVKKSRTTTYHPQGDGMVERFNRTLLQLLRTYVIRQEEWEKHLPPGTLRLQDNSALFNWSVSF